MFAGHEIGVDEASAISGGGQPTQAAKLRHLLQAGLFAGVFFRGDANGMHRLSHQPGLSSQAQELLFFSGGKTRKAFYGHFREGSSAVARRGGNWKCVDGDRESAASLLAQAALREAEIGEVSDAGKLLGEAHALSQSPVVTTLTALSVARLGDAKRTASLSQQLSQAWPVATYMQNYWLPVIHAQIDLSRKQPSIAVDDLGLAGSPLELANPLAIGIATLYPAYVRGEAYLGEGENALAATEFEKVMDHRNLTINYPLGALAIVWRARVYVRNGELQNARKSYQKFLSLWSDADPGIPILKEAKLEYANVQ